MSQYDPKLVRFYTDIYVRVSFKIIIRNLQQSKNIA